MTSPISETKKDPKTNFKNKKYLIYFIVAWLILVAIIIISHSIGFNLLSWPRKCFCGGTDGGVNPPVIDFK